MQPTRRTLPPLAPPTTVSSSTAPFASEDSTTSLRGFSLDSSPLHTSPTLYPHQMGQGASTPHENTEPSASRDDGSAQRQYGHGSPQRQGGSPGAPDMAAARAELRRSRRLHSLSRLGNRLMPSSSSSSASSSGRSRVPGLRFRTRTIRLSGSRSPSPSSALGGSARNGSHSPRHRTLPPISRPYPLDPEFGSSSADMMDISPSPTITPSPPATSTESPSSPVSRRSRMSRVRSSLSINSWPNFISEMGGSRSTRPASRRQSNSHRPGAIDTFLNNYGNEMDTDTPQTPPTPFPDLLDGPRPERSSVLGARNLLEGLDNPARVRPGEDQAAMLSRLLSVAAAATAASLVGNAEQAITEAQDVAGDNRGDGSFESFLRALQNGRLATALRNGGNERGGGAPADGQSENGMLSLNFFRMFRFGSHPATSNSEGGENGSSSADSTPSRMVPVIIVGIRSVTPTPAAEGERQPPFFDALANLPVNLPSMHRGSRISSSNRRASTGAGVRMTTTSTSSSRPASDISPLSAATPSSLTDTPPGPHPPPSTPADPTLPTFTRDSYTPQSSDGVFEDNVHESAGHSESASASNSARESARRRLSRRLSSPEPMHPFMSSQDPHSPGSQEGSSRRSGQRRSPPSNMEGTRSWIIYVLGGSYPENHPILTTPSLFTDAPTYEDMILVSSLLGQAKPPVANAEDVEQAGGDFIVGSENAPADFNPSNGDRCLVCLCDFEEAEECRQLTKCKHVFHKPCIDQWLTTGRNSCPLCRGEGVKEKEKPKEQPAPSITTAATPSAEPSMAS